MATLPPMRQEDFDEDPIETEARYTWGICAVCGQSCRAKGARLYGQVYDDQGRTEGMVPVTHDRSMLCSTHQEQYRFACLHRAPDWLGFHHWVRNHASSHLLFHEFGMHCPECIPCRKCEQDLPMEGDYLCKDCRYG